MLTPLLEPTNSLYTLLGVLIVNCPEEADVTVIPPECCIKLAPLESRVKEPDNPAENETDPVAVNPETDPDKNTPSLKDTGPLKMDPVNDATTLLSVLIVKLPFAPPSTVLTPVPAVNTLSAPREPVAA